MEIILIDYKLIRSLAIRQYLGGRKCYCFSCGNASQALQDAGVDVIAIAPNAPLKTDHYIPPAVSDKWFECFNATSGYLPPYLMEAIARDLRTALPARIFTMDAKKVFVPTGSGETIWALSYLMPLQYIVPITGDLPEIDFAEPYSPLYEFIRHNTQEIIKYRSNEPADFYREFRRREGYLIISDKSKILKYLRSEGI